MEKSYEIDLKLFRPTVESENKKMYDSRAKYEIRILDGELFSLLQTKLLFAFIAIQWFEC